MVCVEGIFFHSMFGFFFKDCCLRGTRITLTSITWLGFMFAFGENVQKKKSEHGKITE